MASGSSAPSVGVSNGEFDESDEMIGAVLVGLATDDGSGWADSIAAVLPNGDWSDALALTCRSTCEKRGVRSTQRYARGLSAPSENVLDNAQPITRGRSDATTPPMCVRETVRSMCARTVEAGAGRFAPGLAENAP